ncbi:MAG: TetR/AcrR family transcriptional regulator [bacterium]|nr:TetR/AcrR family transcriptional regulator [bacterium]
MIRNRAATRERLLGAAEQLLIKKGFQAMGVNAVAARAGIDKVLIYRYFGGFDGLLESIANEREIWPELALPEILTDGAKTERTRNKSGEARKTGGENESDELSSEALPLSRVAANQILWQILQANVQTLRSHALALEILVWSCAESNVLTRAQAKLRRRQTRKLKERLAQLNPASTESTSKGDAAAVYALVWKSYCFALMENHRKEIYKPKDWRLFEQAGQALFAALPESPRPKAKKKKSDKRRSASVGGKAEAGLRGKNKSKAALRSKAGA